MSEEPSGNLLLFIFKTEKFDQQKLIDSTLKLYQSFFYSTYSDWNNGLLTLLVKNLQGNDGGAFCNLVDAYYSLIWATELESRKTAYGGYYFMIDGHLSASAYSSYTCKHNVG